MCQQQDLRGGGVWGGRVPTPRGYPASPQGLLFLAHYGGRVPSGCRRSVPEKRFLEGRVPSGCPSKPPRIGTITRGFGKASSSGSVIVRHPPSTATTSPSARRGAQLP